MSIFITYGVCIILIIIRNDNKNHRYSLPDSFLIMFFLIINLLSF
jgi:hypothetical protein